MAMPSSRARLPKAAANAPSTGRASAVHSGTGRHVRPHRMGLPAGGQALLQVFLQGGAGGDLQQGDDRFRHNDTSFAV